LKAKYSSNAKMIISVVVHHSELAWRVYSNWFDLALPQPGVN
jgi:hypothetical protein